MKVLFFGTYDARRHPHVRVLQEGFEQLGDEVLECNVPLGFTTDERVRMLKQPWRSPALAVRLAKSWRELRARSGSFQDVDIVVVGYMGHFDVHLARRLFKTKPIALDHMIFARDTALDRGISARPLLAALRRLDDSAIKAADVICVDTEGHREMLPAGTDSIVCPLGATSRWFTEPTERPDGRLKVIFHGLFAPLQGAPVLGEAMSACAGDPIDFTMVGRGQDLAATQKNAAGNPNITWHDFMSPDELPSLVAQHDVCLGIFGTGPKGLRVVPHKVFEGAASGCAIITAGTPPQRQLLGDAALFVPPGNAEAIAEALRSLAKDRSQVESYRRAAYSRAKEAFHPRAIVEPLRAKLLTRLGS
jgi:glycosyltransferase involved in cell wall biosynthesis